jgi:small-conductance mechanosensitive channel
MRFLALFCLFIIHAFSAFGQQPKGIDSSLRKLLKDELNKEIEKTTNEIKERKALARQSDLFSDLRKTYEEAKNYVRNEIDTSAIENEIRKIQVQSNIAADGIFTNKGSIQTARNLSLSSILYTELINKANKRKDQVEENLQVLLALRNRIDSFALDSNLVYIPSDSILLNDFLLKVGLFNAETENIDSVLNIELKKNRELSVKISLLVFTLKSRLQDIENYRKELSNSSTHRELASLWGNVGYTRPFKDILHFSLLKNEFVLNFYITNHNRIFLLLIILFIALGGFLKLLKTEISNEMGIYKHTDSSLILRKPYATALFISLMLWHFFLPTPPYAIYAGIWTTAALSLLVILRSHINQFWMLFFIFLLGLFISASFLYFILQASRVERYYMFALSLIGVAFGMFFALSKQKEQLKEKFLIPFLWVFVIMELTALVCNLFGLYNIGKAILTSGFIGLLVGIMLLWTVRLLTEIFKISAEAYRDSEKNRYYIDFEKIGSEIPQLLYITVPIGWFVLIGRNFYIYKQITDPITEFFTKSISLGSYSFSLSNLLLFIVIIIAASLISKAVTFLYGGGSKNAPVKKGGLGSWLLLIRIGIIISGLFLAFAAVGIPLDRITIIFGGLSVGIGFGLQAIFESLISGIIIAFEKSINVGDEVEFDGQSGIMKSIGFRSSVITTFDGSNVVIPNNDILKSHLVNWTFNNSNRRIELIVGVEYTTDLDKAFTILMNAIAKDKRILKHPAPKVLAKEFSANSIDLRLLFWISNNHPWDIVKSDLMRNIKIAFEDAGIGIPFPQLVVHDLTQEKKLDDQSK